MSSKIIYDKHGNRIGEDVITTDRDGRVHITHYDNHHNRVGRSFETTDHRGEVYMIHEDARGNRLGRSTVERDWWGDYYVKTEETAQARRQRQEEAEWQKKQNNVDSDDIDDSAGAVGDALYGIVMLLVKIFAFVFIGSFLYGIVGAAGATIWVPLLIPVLNQSSHLSQIGPAFIVLLAPIWISYFPYVGILLYRRWKKEINWKDFFIAILRWAIIGPFAYRKLVRQMQAEKLPRPGALPILKKDQVFCRNCGCISGSQDRFCKKCGAELRREDCIHDVDIPIPGEKS